MSDNHRDHLIRIEKKLDRVSDKLEAHLDRISSVETSLSWTRSILKGIGALTITVMGAIIKLFIDTKF